jgi:TPR repeat protein
MSIETRLDEFLRAERIPTADEMYRMGIEASTGADDGKVDLVMAHKWFNLAALQGNEDAMFYRRQLTEEMEPRQIAAAQRLAREWLRKHRPAVDIAA